MRVLKGKKLSGHMGADTITIQNLTIIEIDTELNYILVSGNIPGPKNSLVTIKEAIKGGKKEEFELISYEEVVETEEVNEDVVDEIIDEHVEESKTEDVVEEVITETTEDNPENLNEEESK